MSNWQKPIIILLLFGITLVWLFSGCSGYHGVPGGNNEAENGAETDPYIGGVEFDLADFRSKTDDSPWPADGRMRYIRIIDDNTILEWHDYLKELCFGANMPAAMGLNC